MNEDRLHDMHDRQMTRHDPHSPWYEGRKREVDPDRAYEEMRDRQEGESE